MGHRVVVLVLPGVLPLDLSIPMQIFGLDPHYDLVLCADALEGLDAFVQLTGSRTVMPLTAMGDADTVIVPGVADPGSPVGEATLAALAAARTSGVRIAAICTGAFVLAAAGLLDGRPATTHWQEADRLQHEYPAISVDPRPLFIDDGEVLTSAGVTAGIDLCLHMIDQDFGARAALARARAIVAPPRRLGDQAQYIPPISATSSPSFAGLRAWMIDHLTEPQPLAVLASRAHCSYRTLSRRFVAETGMTPRLWLTRLRLDKARELLESTALPIEQIGDRVGLGSAPAFRAVFRDAFGISPADYRRTFRSSAR